MTTEMTISKALINYEQTLINRSKLTLISYRTSLKTQFCSWLVSEFGVPSVQEVLDLPTTRLPPDSLEKYYLWLVQERGCYIKGEKEVRTGVTHRSAQAYVAAAISFFRFLDRRGFLAPNVRYLEMVDGLKQVFPRNANVYDAPKVDRGGLPKLLYAVMDEPVPEINVKNRYSCEMSRLIVLRDRAIILTLWATGMRRAEVANLNCVQVDDGRQGEVIIKGKGSKERVVWFDEITLDAIAAYLKERGDTYQPLFIRHDRHRGEPIGDGDNYRLTPIAVWQIIKKYAAKAGVPTAKTHDFRHAKATNMLNRGAKLEEVQDVLGHASPVTTKQIYAHYSKKHLAEANTRYSVSVADALKGDN